MSQILPWKKNTDIMSDKTVCVFMLFFCMQHYKLQYSVSLIYFTTCHAVKTLTYTMNVQRAMLLYCFSQPTCMRLGEDEYYPSCYLVLCLLMGFFYYSAKQPYKYL